MSYFPYFTKKELVMSLCCPAITFLWGLLLFIIDFPWGKALSENGVSLLLPPIIGLAAALVGGALPVVLTLRLKIHTEKYLIPRLIIIVVIFVCNRFIRNLFIPGGTNVSTFVLYMVFNVGAVLIQILKVHKKDAPPEERAVFIISDPILYWALYFLAYYMVIFIG